MKKYTFPMTNGIMTSDGKGFLGLVFRGADAGFALYEIEKNQILFPLYFTDASDWKKFSYNDGYPGGISDTGALFISRYIMKTVKEKQRVAGMELAVFDPVSGKPITSFPVSGDESGWESDHRLLTAAAAGDDRYLYAVTADDELFLYLYNDRTGKTVEVLEFEEDEGDFRSVRFDPETRILEARVFTEPGTTAFTPVRFDICRWEILEDFRSARLLNRQHVSMMEGEEFPEGTITIRKNKLGFLKGSELTFCDAATGEELYGGTDNLKVDFEYLPLLSMDTILIRMNPLVSKTNEVCVLHRENGGFQRFDLLTVTEDAEITWSEEQGWICICGDDTTVYRV